MEINKELNNKLFLNTLYKDVNRMNILGNQTNIRSTFTLKVLTKYYSLLHYQFENGNTSVKEKLDVLEEKINKLVLSCSQICS